MTNLDKYPLFFLCYNGCMKILIASDSYKGSLTSKQVANIITQAIYEKDQSIEVFSLPIADGGEGSLECALNIQNAKLIECEVHGPYDDLVLAKYVKINQTAIIEMAEASGLMKDVRQMKNPLLASTFGTGELMIDALNKGCTDFILCLGGSATNDAGCGMASALGVKFMCQDERLKPIPNELRKCTHVDLSNFDSRIEGCTFTLACDVNNPLLGECGASYVFGPQKGAKDVEELDQILSHVSNLLEKETGNFCRNNEGAGAAGGLGFGLMCLCNAHKRSGIEVMLELTHFEDIVQKVDLVITGEGKTDKQTAFGKAPVGIAKVSKKHNKPVVLISGVIEPDADLSEFGIVQQISCVPYGSNIEEAILNAENNLYVSTKKMMEEIYGNLV